MPLYAPTPAALLAAESDIELIARLAGPSDQPVVSGALLRLAVAGGSMAAYSAGEQAAASQAVARMEAACAAAGEMADAALAARYPAGLSPVPGIVAVAAVSLALEDLLGSRPAGPDTAYYGIVRRAKLARDTLAALASGALTMGVGSPAPGGIRYRAAPRVCTYDTLEGM